MDKTTESLDTTSLARRLDELEAENAKLRAATRSRTVGGRRWRGVVSAVAIVLASILLPLSIVGAWARVQLVDEEAFVGVFAPLIDDAAVQELIVDETMAAVNAQVDFVVLTDQVFDGISELGLPARASTALDLLRQPAADGLRNLVESAVSRVVASDAFSAVWSSSLYGAHRALTFAATSDGAGIVVLTPDEVRIEIGPLVEEVKAVLTERGIGAAVLIPEVDRSISVGDGQTLVMLRTTYALADTLGGWMPFAALALFALGIGIARRRSAAVLGAGIGIAVGCGVLGIGLMVGASVVATMAGTLGLAPDALGVIYNQIIDGIRWAAWMLFSLGVITALVGWLLGASTSAERVRAKARAVIADR